jgi:integrase
MATIQKRRNRGGSTSFVAWVRVKPFKPVARAFKSRAEASAWADDHARELREHRSRGDADADLTRLTLAQLAREYLDDSEVRALGDYATIEQRLAWWVEHYGTVRVLRLGAITLRKAREKLKPGRKPSTVNRYLSILRACWNWGRATELIPLKLVWPPRLMLKEPQGIVRYLSDDELHALLKAAAQYSVVMYVAILFSIATGVRMSELRRFRWADIEFERQHIRILLTKNHESRGGYLPATAVPALQHLKRQSVVGLHVFIQDDGKPVSKDWISCRWKIIRANAKLVNFRWHDLRHSCASLLAQNGSNLLEIGSVLGHKSPASTKRYTHLVEHAPVTGHPKLDERLRSSVQPLEELAVQ